MKILDVLARFLRTRASAMLARAGGVPKSRRPCDLQISVPSTPQAQGRPARDPGDSPGAKSFPVDPSLPQLEIAGNPELMREVFQRHLRPLGGKAYQVLECPISHTRYRMATRCMLQYTLRLREPGTRLERSQVVTGTMYPGGRTRRVWEELRRSDLGEETLGASPPAFEPFSYIPDLDMLVQVFPYDRQLPALPLLMAGPPPYLEPLLLARFGPGDWRTEGWDVEPVRYRTENKATLRITVRAQDVVTSRAEEKRFYAKVYQDEQMGEQTHEALRALWENTGAGGEGFAVSRPIAYLSDLRTLIQEEATGTSLEDILLRGDDVTPVMRKAARDLAALHLGHTVTSGRYHSRDNIARMKRAGDFLQRTCPCLRPEIEETIGAVVAGLEEAPLAPTHGDLKPDHVMLDGERLVLIDLDDFAWADPVLDVARFSTVLTDAPLLSTLSHDHRRAVARVFIEEYFAYVPEGWRVRLPLHYAGAYIRIAFGLLRNQPPGWPEKVEAMVKEARDSLAGKVW